MKKLIVSAVAALSLVAGSASAQSYYPTYSYTGSSACVSITQNLSVGSRGTQVSALQRFLVAQNYPGSGAWMVTGYFGAATRAAVRDFQQSQGLSQSGIVDMQTQIAIDRVSCGGTSSSNYPSYPSYPSYPTYPTYPSYPSYPYNNYTAPTIISLSQNTGVPGNTVTISGQGFDYSNNTVNFGDTYLSGISSSNGTSLSFTIPYLSSGTTNQTLQLSVITSRGTSNSVSFTLNPNTGCNNTYNYGYSNNNCNGCSGYSYTYGTNCGCNNTYAYTTSCNPCGYNYSTYPYNYGNTCNTCGSNSYTTYLYTNTNCNGNTSSPTITYLSPQSGATGATVTVYGSGFTTNGNTVHFGNGIITGLNSPDGQSISFTVPSQLTGYGSQPVTTGSYSVYVTNANNYNTNSTSFTVTSTNSSNGAPNISSITPTSAQVGQQVTIYGSNFLANNSSNTILFGSGAIQNVYSNGSSITFTVPSYVAPYCQAGYACPQYVQQVTPGTYNISVMNPWGTSNTVQLTVY